MESYVGEMLGTPHCLDNRLRGVGELLALRAGPALLPRNISLLLVLMFVRG
jgi:hypothetical protein